MKPPTLLPPELLWRDDGHLSDVAVVALADAQDVLPLSAKAHADSCETCGLRIGEAALLSLAAGAALGSAAGSSKQPARPLPVPAIIGALAIAAAGAAPLALDLPRWLPQTPALAARVLPVIARGALAAMRSSPTGGALTVSLASVVVLMAAMLTLARLSPRVVSKEGAVR